MINHFRLLNSVRLEMTARDRLFDETMQAIFANTVSLGTGMILLLAGQSMHTGTFTVGDFALFVYYRGWITEFTAHFGRALTLYKQAGVSIERLIALLQEAPAHTLIQHGPIYIKNSLPALSEAPEREKDQLRAFDVTDLTYYYPGTNRGVEHINLHIEHGTFTVITGRIGSGKTTLLQTLLGLLPKESGEICWNTTPVERPASFFVPPHSSYTSQVPHLFSEILRDNILLGLPEHDEILAMALRLTVLEPDIAEMKQGLDTLFGPKEVRLSSGQLQRAATTRIFVRPASLLIVDDLSSGWMFRRRHSSGNASLHTRKQRYLQSRIDGLSCVELIVSSF
jgi:ATP-binding cassette subfamily B protein